ncbi:MAG: DnaJ domain-containing protein [Acutalibacteraceae bacterium]|jgi:molecular chaperone DnaJ|nr:DnaJ domain-containing protein [Acutalibacteraceae bacterium]
MQQDPYQVLGVSREATDEEIKTAYRNLAKKYHPDNYTDTPLSDVASEKMKEINEAYDTVMNARRNGGNAGNPGGGYGGYYNANPGYGSSSKYSDVRVLIQTGRLADAEQILDGVPAQGRDAEWHFLKGTIMLKKGWTEEAYKHMQTACAMDPGNGEYRQAMGYVQSRRGGAYGGYNTQQPVGGGCSTCDLCSGLCCADCCCECMGGDLIPCC